MRAVLLTFAILAAFNMIVCDDDDQLILQLMRKGKSYEEALEMVEGIRDGDVLSKKKATGEVIMVPEAIAQRESNLLSKISDLESHKVDPEIIKELKREVKILSAARILNDQYNGSQDQELDDDVQSELQQEQREEGDEEERAERQKILISKIEEMQKMGMDEKAIKNLKELAENVDLTGRTIIAIF